MLLQRPPSPHPIIVGKSFVLDVVLIVWLKIYGCDVIPTQREDPQTRQGANSWLIIAQQLMFDSCINVNRFENFFIAIQD